MPAYIGGAKGGVSILCRLLLVVPFDMLERRCAVYLVHTRADSKTEPEQLQYRLTARVSTE